mmetsp:Transcript_14901/g.25387  ORF Transcript_14901/g.25387 Transcript_14901/m.25387 type:complete len:156 (-) Transcript_14901:808-1275(-)
MVEERSSLLDDDQDVQMKQASSVPNPISNQSLQNMIRQEEQKDGAPIEIKKKEAQLNVKGEEIAVVKSDADLVKRERMEQEKQKMKAKMTKLFKQLKVGCDKDICFSRECRKNPFTQEYLSQHFKEDIQLLRFVMESLQSTQEIPFCDGAKSVNS